MNCVSENIYCMIFSMHPANDDIWTPRSRDTAALLQGYHSYGLFYTWCRILLMSALYCIKNLMNEWDDKYTQQNSSSISHILGTLTMPWLNSDDVVTVDNCLQHGDYTVEQQYCHCPVTMYSLCLGDWWNRSLLLCTGTLSLSFFKSYQTERLQFCYWLCTKT